ncbi:TPA: hypothetical protein O4825_001934 [Staphylococcus aureus]|uniref:hypothetical protein n=1 Tax=Staphylococcus aureus TaxID=1280 RepID=UPI001BDC5005|nr:hypothetical protein [Staphylococcus aureus]HAR7312134.1 hypothetical protein [Staphylococcus aureus]HDA0274878.1 hypothetical protein [Staphylococcus aureus]HDA3138415.1 hypothetical protein [Staphylococcus aureus]HDF4715758.1 hypothetical protein [Staphylococcus aureus]
MKSELSNSGIDVTVKDVEKYMNRYNEVMKGKNDEKAKELCLSLLPINIIVVFTFFVFIL